MSIKSWNTNIVIPNFYQNWGFVQRGSRTHVHYTTADAIWSRVKPASLSPTPMVIVRYDTDTVTYYEGKPGVFKYRWGDWFHVYNDRTYRETTSSDDIQNRNAIALKSRSKFTAEKLNLGETFGSLNQTVKMIAKRVGTLSSIADLLHRRIDPHSVNKALPPYKGSIPKDVSAAFLEYKFGWQQLVSDIYLSLELLERKIQKGDVVRKSSGSKVKRPRRLGLIGPPADLGKLALSSTSGGVIGNPAIHTLNELGLANLPLLMWQLTRASFIVDWIYNVSDVLASWTWSLGLTDTWTCTISETREIDYQIIGGKRFNRQQKMIIYRRVHLPEAFLLQPSAKIRQIQWQSDKIAVASALLVQLLKRP